MMLPQTPQREKDTQSPRGKAIKLQTLTSHTQHNICFEGSHEFPGSDVGMEMPSSLLQETKIPTREMQLCSSMVPCPAAGSAPGSALLATFPGIPLAVHVHILQVGEKEEPKEHLKYCFTLFTELGVLIFTMTFSF